jgi:hypothetical protein
MNKLFYLALAPGPAFGQVTVNLVSSPAAGGTVSVAQAAAGMTLGNGTLPCVGLGGGDCYGVPANAVVVQPVSFIEPGTTPTWYAVYQIATG